jgi:hypothetical protein
MDETSMPRPAAIVRRVQLVAVEADRRDVPMLSIPEHERADG